MPDITMCSGDNCKQKEKCWRFTARPDPLRQSFFATPVKKDGSCDYFWPNDGRRSKKEDAMT